MRNAFIFHGSGGGPGYYQQLPPGRRHWLQRCESKLRKAGFHVVAPQFPTDRQTPDAWKAEFRRSVVGRGPLYRINEQTLLIGHSLGARFALDVAADIGRQGREVAGTFLVSCPLDYGEIASDGPIDEFLATAPAIDWAAARRGAGTVAVYHSDNDPYVPLRNGIETAVRMGVDLTVLRGRKHFTADVVDSIPEVMSDLWAVARSVERERVRRRHRLGEAEAADARTLVERAVLPMDAAAESGDLRSATPRTRHLEGWRSPVDQWNESSVTEGPRPGPLDGPTSGGLGLG